jgi:hypothetical protein
MHTPGARAATEPVFHYTDGNGLLGIAHRGVLWASEAAGLNDRAEIRQGWAKIRAWLDAQPEGEIVELFKSHAASPLRDSHEVFVVCGSTRGDDANQWRLYANKGAGYAVELDPEQQLVVVTDNPPPPAKEPKVGRIDFGRIGDQVEVTPWLHVIYDEDEIADALTELVAKAQNLHDSIESLDEDENVKSDGFEHLNETTYADLAELAHLIKEPGFAGENEVRVVVTFFWGMSHVKYRSGAYGVVGYAELSSPPRGRGTSRVVDVRKAEPLPIRSVRTGPLLHKDHTTSVESFLRNIGHSDAEVFASAVPLR